MSGGGPFGHRRTRISGETLRSIISLRWATTFQVLDMFMDARIPSVRLFPSVMGDGSSRCTFLQIGCRITIGFKTGAVRSTKQLCGGGSSEVEPLFGAKIESEG